MTIATESLNLLENPRFKEFIEAFGALSKKASSLDAARKLSTEFFLPPSTVYEPIDRVENLEIEGTDGNRIAIRLFIPKSETPLPTLLYFHRGGWVFGNINEAEPVCRKLARYLHLIVVAVEYRLAPENPFPKPLNDCYSATMWTFQNIVRFNGNPDQISVCGESAGGNLAAAVALRARDTKGPKLFSQLLICPFFNASINPTVYENSVDRYFITKEAMQFFWSVYLGEDKDNPYASLDRASDYSNLPPLLMITAEFDPLHQEAVDYANNLAQAGVTVIAKCFSQVIHGFIDLPIYDEEEKTAWIKEIGDAFHKLSKEVRK